MEHRKYYPTETQSSGANMNQIYAPPTYEQATLPLSQQK